MGNESRCVLRAAVVAVDIAPPVTWPVVTSKAEAEGEIEGWEIDAAAWDDEIVVGIDDDDDDDDDGNDDDNDDVVGIGDICAVLLLEGEVNELEK